MNKLVLIIIYLSFYFSSIANMAEPVTYGTLGSNAFTSSYVDIRQEILKIKIDENFQYAYFDVEYHIYASKSGVQIPLLFVASYLLGDFKVSIDGKAIETQKIPNELIQNDSLSGFLYLFDEEQKEGAIYIEDRPGGKFAVSMNDLVYFETDIPEGNHIIKVSYKASVWIDYSDWINKYSFRYALSPAKYWKSFGSLKVVIDASDFKQTIETNLGKPSQGDLNAIAGWEFDKIPVNLIMIEFKPEINKTAQILLSISPMGLALIFGFVLMLLHIYLTWLYRKKHSLVKISSVVIAGSLLVPLLFLIFWLSSYYMIDEVIGKHAGSNHGYSFIVLFLYPVILPVYWLIIWLIDRYIFKK